MRMHIWTGRLDEVRSHAEKALATARRTEDTTLEFWSQWAMGAMEGLIGNTREMARRIGMARELATRIGSPLLPLEIAELEVVEHWLKANANMVALTIKSLQFQRDMIKGGEKALKAAQPGEEPGEIPNPAMWAWNMMAEAAKAAQPAPEPEKEKKRPRKR